MPLALCLLAAPGQPTANPALPLADSLFCHGLYSAASTEFRRALFLGPDSTGVTDVKLGLSLGAAGELERAAEVLRQTAEQHPELSHVAGTSLAGLFTLNAAPERARLEVLDLLAFARDSARRRELQAALAWLNLSAEELGPAESCYTEIGRPAVAAEIRRIDQLHGRNPALAAIMSSLVPGSGEVYAGRPLPGLLSFVVTGGSAAGVYLAARSDDWVTAALVFSVFFLRFYNGSRANASDFAAQFNHRQRRRELEALTKKQGLRPDWFRAARQLIGLPLPEAWNPGPIPGSETEPGRALGPVPLE